MKDDARRWKNRRGHQGAYTKISASDRHDLRIAKGFGRGNAAEKIVALKRARSPAQPRANARIC